VSDDTHKNSVSGDSRKLSVSADKPRWASAVLVLEDGRTFWGKRVGAYGEGYGEIVFNTAMCGYQEILTDPSYAGQIITFTYPLIGNYGVQREAYESRKAYTQGVVLREHSLAPSPWTAEARLNEFLDEQGIVGISEVDTRALTRHIRKKGELRAVISSIDSNIEALIKKVRRSPGLAGRDLAGEVSHPVAYAWTQESPPETDPPSPSTTPPTDTRGRILVYDFGVKRGILRSLAERGFEVVVVPASTPAKTALAYDPLGIVLSNGPGDPAAVQTGIETIRGLIGKLPILGICLGHQLAALALGARTEKLKFGHHGANHPVLNIESGQVEITSQNHGFVVTQDSLPENAVVTHQNLNDKTLEGFAIPELNLQCVQFHPEASPGPLDSRNLFDQFADRCEKAAAAATT
jgi:carbamoyl-phosphate synthase small subunit